MGGHIAWILRLEDGTEYRMNRHTNEMPALIQAPAFLDGSPEGIDAALKPWLEMKRDWETHHETGALTNSRTPEYGPYPFGLRPIEYGLILTDFKTRSLLSLQSYSFLDKGIDRRLLMGDKHGRSLAPLREAGRVDHYQLLVSGEVNRTLFEAAGFEPIEHSSKETWWFSIPGDFDYETLAELCDQARGDIFKDVGLHSANAMLDLAPFEYRRFDETPAGYRALRDHLLDLEFDIEEEDDDAWALRLAELEQLEAEGLL